MKEPSVLTVAQVAQSLGVDPAVVELWAEEKRIPHFRLGEHVYFRSETLDLWFRKLELENPSNGGFKDLLVDPVRIGVLLDDLHRAVEQLRSSDEDARRIGALALGAAAKLYPGAQDQIASIVLRHLRRSLESLRDSKSVLNPRGDVHSMLETLASLGSNKIDLRDAYLPGISFKGLELPKAVLVNADLRGAVLPNANLASGNLQWADLSGAVLSSSDLSAAKLASAKLVGANLQRASLRDANLTGADLTDTLLQGADFSGADLSDVLGFGQDHLNSITVDERTRLPVGLQVTMRIDGEPGDSESVTRTFGSKE